MQCGFQSVSRITRCINVLIALLVLARCKSLFLGVTIDDKLTWHPHIKHLRKLLTYCTGSLNRIRGNVTPDLYKSLYHTLFEFYLTYRITVWGEASDQLLAPLLCTQKQCCRIMFGDRDAHNNDKFKTCARTRVYGEQTLGPDHYMREHTKPLMTKHSILNVYTLQCLPIPLLHPVP